MLYSSLNVSHCECGTRGAPWCSSSNFHSVLVKIEFTCMPCINNTQTFRVSLIRSSICTKLGCFASNLLAFVISPNRHWFRYYSFPTSNDFKSQKNEKKVQNRHNYYTFWCCLTNHKISKNKQTACTESQYDY